MYDNYDEAIKLWKTFDIRSAQELRKHLDNFPVLFSYNSGAIENPEITYHDTREVFENGCVIGYTGTLRTLYEISNLKDSYRFMLRCLGEKRPIDLNLIREMHFQITKGTYGEHRLELGERPGEFKKNDCWGVGLHDIAAPVAEVESNLQDDINELMEFGSSKPLVAAAWFHARFEGIHAFADGNGRTGRALMNYYLISNGHPPIVIYEEDRRSYYDALDEFDMTGDLLPLIRFLKAQTAKTWQASVERHEISRQHELGEPEVFDSISRSLRERGLERFLNDFHQDSDRKAKGMKHRGDLCR